MRFAAIDIGSNSCRLLIADGDGNELTPVYRQLETTRISAGLNESGKISKEAMERTLLCLEKFKKSMADQGVVEYRAIATSAVREASNGEDFIQLAAQRSRLEIDVVSGEEEARLSYLGVEKGLQLNHQPLVVDLGGGSTEFICNGLNFVRSIPLGAVRATELKMTVQDIAGRLKGVAELKDKFLEYPLVMAGGTASSLVAIKLGLEKFDAGRVHGQILSRQDLSDLYQMLEKTPLSLRKRLPGLQAERADIINQGALIVLMIVDMLNKTELIVSETDLLQGMLWATDSLKKIS